MYQLRNFVLQVLEKFEGFSVSFKLVTRDDAILTKFNFFFLFCSNTDGSRVFCERMGVKEKIIMLKNVKQIQHVQKKCPEITEKIENE